MVIDIADAWICHTDIALLRNEWMEGIFLMVPGYEITGTVVAVGSGVSRHAVGDGSVSAPTLIRAGSARTVSRARKSTA